MEVWAGVECTVNRIGDRFLDQLKLTGHDRRPEDLETFAEAGVTAIRYPILWERTQHWSWPDRRLGRIRELGLRPIVGLVHHGSGPLRTSLLDAQFPARLARYAGRVARRYPWVEDWTPVNEPLTTARFSALYGHWYPHVRDDHAFGRALENQLRAVVLAMRAIRDVVPSARLVQTEDVGKTHASLELAYQADFDDERRWLTFDLLHGRANGTALYYGIDTAWFEANPCPPAILGVNHYLSSERFLDVETPGPGNGRHRYADRLAPNDRRIGPEGILREVRARYDARIAVTEAHNGCTREEQLRWLDDVWRAAGAVDGVQAVTVWAWFGGFGWRTLATGGTDYEEGAYDVRATPPRPTALARMVKSLARTGMHVHPVLDGKGWWRRRSGQPARGRRLLVTGAGGTLGQAFARACEVRGLAYEVAGRRALDIANAPSVAQALETWRPWAVVNAAGYVRVDEAENDTERCFRENRDGARVLARACGAAEIPLVTFSSDLVFDGAARRPYVEPDAPAPLNVYGRSKEAAERLVLESCPHALVFRTSAFFGPWDRWNFVTQALATMAAGNVVVADGETVVSPTYVPDLVRWALDLLIDGESGIWHAAGSGETTWSGLARASARAAGVRALVREIPAPDLPAARPRYSALASVRGAVLPDLEESLARYARERLAA